MMRAAKQSPSVQSVQEVGKDVRIAVWSEITTCLLRGLKALLEGLLEEEVSTHLGAVRYERTKSRQGHRNGHYTRDLITQHGPLGIPRLLEGGMDFTCFDHYPRRQGFIDAATGQLFLQGTSTRKLKSIAQDLFGAPVSAGTVSNVISTLDADLQAYQSKLLSDDIVFLFLDGARQKECSSN